MFQRLLPSRWTGIQRILLTLLEGPPNYPTSRALTGTSGVLKILELYLIRKLGTLGRGNIHKENVIFKPGGVINVKRIIGPTHGRIPDKILSAFSSSINTNIRW